jgi:hypothetical protein
MDSFTPKAEAEFLHQRYLYHGGESYAGNRGESMNADMNAEMLDEP